MSAPYVPLETEWVSCVTWRGVQRDGVVSPTGLDGTTGEWRRQDWGYSERFPRVTLCEFEIRYQSRVHNYIVQCVLTINLFNEKIFMFLWFWMVFVTVASGLSLALWLCRALVYADRVRFAENHLQMGDRIQVPAGVRDAELAHKFACDYLRQDGALLLRLIAHNTDNVTTTELVCSLWDSWKDSYVDTASTPLTATAASQLYPRASDMNGLKDVKGFHNEKS